jgi:hypothetical protein
MAFIIWALVTVLTGYLAYRSIRGGFDRSQSKRLNIFGYLGCFLIIVYALAILSWLFA